MRFWADVQRAWHRRRMRGVAIPGVPASPAQDPFVYRQPHVYDPDREVFAGDVNRIDEAHRQFRGFASAVREGSVALTLDAVAYDGQREIVDLSPEQAKAYIECATAEARRQYRFARIRESRLAVAKIAAERLRAGASLDDLKAPEEAALRECGALDEHDQLREDFGTPWDTAQAIAVPYLDQEYLPYGQGPLGMQLYLADMWAQLSQAWWAWHHDPLAKQGINIVVTFVLAGGAQIQCQDEGVQAVVDEFWKRETMDLRLRSWLTDLGRDGELFVRLIPDGTGKMRVRSLDPTTIWEIITDAEDIEKVYGYAQRYMTRTQLLSMPGIDPQKYIERELLPDNVIHTKINASSSEVRGRSDLFAILGMLKRLRDYLTSEVLKAQAAAAYHRDVTIDGSDADVQAFAAAEAQQGTPQPGETWYHNKSVTVAMVQGANRTPAANGSVYAGLVNLIAVGLGISKEYLGVVEDSSTAAADVATDPAFQTFEVRQQLTRDLLERLIQRVIIEAQRYGRVSADASQDFGVIFRGIRQDDKGKKIDRLATAEGMGWISKETAANAAAPELDLPDFDFEAECDAIADESHAIILQKYEQVPKGYPQLTQSAYAPGSVPNPNAGAPPSPKPTEARERAIVIYP